MLKLSISLKPIYAPSYEKGRGRGKKRTRIAERAIQGSFSLGGVEA